jgi:phage shock protein A
MTPNKLQELLDLKEEIEKLKEEIERKDILISDLKYELHKEDPDNNRMEHHAGSARIVGEALRASQQEERYIKIRLRKKKETEDWKQHYKAEIANRDIKIKLLTATIGEIENTISELENTIEESAGGERRSQKQSKMNVIIVN